MASHHLFVLIRRAIHFPFVKFQSAGDVVVYGDGLDAYTCVEALLSMRIPGSGIHLVRPPSEGSCFDGPAVGKAVGTALEKSQVHVHHGCLLAQMNEGRDPEPLTSVSFAHAAGDPLLLRCSVSRGGFTNVDLRVLILPSKVKPQLGDR